ncbi:MAG: tRNA (adenosine(37)-N6)-threonylcarbamoyltransferase complex dimerization subunit type 1 TsaB [Firmicutes bacterium]|nr:tRNA (adenosine(37)-N6)-threonylcarbamoyltransferase complex dimerization subunit type 1 TsaB [Bacillota bacterium]
MRVLAFDTSASIGSVAVVDDSGPIGEVFFTVTRARSEETMAICGHLLGDLGFKLRDMNGIGVGVGPGSFTGVRIAVTMAKTLSYMLKIPLAGVLTLDALAHAMRFWPGVICPMIAARRRQVYAASYTSYDCLDLSEPGGERPGTGKGRRPSQPAIVDVDVVIEDMAGLGEDVLFTGDGAARYRAEIEGAFARAGKRARAHVALGIQAAVHASSIAEIARCRIEAGDVDDPFTLAPFYLRKSGAELVWEQRSMRSV